MMKKFNSVDEYKVNNDDVGGSTTTRVYNKQGLALVMMMKKILDKNCTNTGNVSELEVCEVLRKLESMELSFKTLEATMIGKTVNALRKHASEKVRKMAVRIVKEWKRTFHEWFKKQSNDVKQTSEQQVKPTSVSMINREKKLVDSEKAKKIGNIGAVVMMVGSLEKLEATKSLQPKSTNVTNMINTEKKLEVKSERVSKIGKGGVNVMMDSSMEKLEATKRKLQEGYEKVENMKKKRRIQVMELHKVTKYGLLPQVNKPSNKPIKKRQIRNWRR